MTTKQKVKLDVSTLRVESFRATEMPAAERGTVFAHGPSARCPTGQCTEFWGGYTCPFTCAYTCI